MTQIGEKTSNSHRQALRNFFLAAAGLVLLIGAATWAANIAPAGAPPIFSPGLGILITVLGVAGFAIATRRYFERTDEHDRSANLWGLSLAWLAISVVAPAWWLLAHSGVLPPIDFGIVYLISAVVGAAVWTWLRFR